MSKKAIKVVGALGIATMSATNMLNVPVNNAVNQELFVKNYSKTGVNQEQITKNKTEQKDSAHIKYYDDDNQNMSDIVSKSILSTKENSSDTMLTTMFDNGGLAPINSAGTLVIDGQTKIIKVVNGKLLPVRVDLNDSESQNAIITLDNYEPVTVKTIINNKGVQVLPESIKLTPVKSEGSIYFSNPNGTAIEKGTGVTYTIPGEKAITTSLGENGQLVISSNLPSGYNMGEVAISVDGYQKSVLVNGIVEGKQIVFNSANETLTPDVVIGTANLTDTEGKEVTNAEGTLSLTGSLNGKDIKKVNVNVTTNNDGTLTAKVAEANGTIMNGTLSINGYNSVNVTAKVENGQLIFGKIPKLEGQGEKIYNLIKLANSTEIPTEYIVPGTKVSYSIVDNQTGKVTTGETTTSATDGEISLPIYGSVNSTFKITIKADGYQPLVLNTHVSDYDKVCQLVNDATGDYLNPYIYETGVWAHYNHAVEVTPYQGIATIYTGGGELVVNSDVEVYINGYKIADTKTDSNGQVKFNYPVSTGQNENIKFVVGCAHGITVKTPEGKLVKKSNFGEGQVQYNVTAENGKLIFNNKSYENYNYKNNVYVGDAWVSVPFKVPGSVIKSGDVPSLEIDGYKASHVSFTLNKDKNGGYINYQTPPIPFKDSYNGVLSISGFKPINITTHPNSYQQQEFGDGKIFVFYGNDIPLSAYLQSNPVTILGTNAEKNNEYLMNSPISNEEFTMTLKNSKDGKTITVHGHTNAMGQLVVNGDASIYSGESLEWSLKFDNPSIQKLAESSDIGGTIKAVDIYDDNIFKKDYILSAPTKKFNNIKFESGGKALVNKTVSVDINGLTTEYKTNTDGVISINAPENSEKIKFAINGFESVVGTYKTLTNGNTIIQTINGSNAPVFNMDSSKVTPIESKGTVSLKNPNGTNVDNIGSTIPVVINGEDGTGSVSKDGQVTITSNLPNGTKVTVTLKPNGYEPVTVDGTIEGGKIIFNPSSKTLTPNTATGTITVNNADNTPYEGTIPYKITGTDNGKSINPVDGTVTTNKNGVGTIKVAEPNGTKVTITLTPNNCGPVTKTGIVEGGKITLTPNTPVIANPTVKNGDIPTGIKNKKVQWSIGNNKPTTGTTNDNGNLPVNTTEPDGSKITVHVHVDGYEPMNIPATVKGGKVVPDSTNIPNLVPITSKGTIKIEGYNGQKVNVEITSTNSNGQVVTKTENLPVKDGEITVSGNFEPNTKVSVKVDIPYYNSNTVSSEVGTNGKLTFSPIKVTPIESKGTVSLKNPNGTNVDNIGSTIPVVINGEDGTGSVSKDGQVTITSNLPNGTKVTVTLKPNGYDPVTVDGTIEGGKIIFNPSSKTLTPNTPVVANPTVKNDDNLGNTKSDSGSGNVVVNNVNKVVDGSESSNNSNNGASTMKNDINNIDKGMKNIVKNIKDLPFTGLEAGSTSRGIFDIGLISGVLGILAWVFRRKR